MDIFKIVGFSIIALVCIIILKQSKKEMGVTLSIFVSGVLLLFILTKVGDIVGLLETLISKSGINATYLTIVLKVTGIAYLVEFSKNICMDAGESALASKVELAGKVIIVSLTIPIVLAVLDTVTKFI